MKITYFFTDLGTSGGPMTLYNFMNCLHEFGHEVYVVTRYESFRWEHNTYLKYLNKRSRFSIAKRIARYKIMQLLTGQNNLSQVAVYTWDLIRNYRTLEIDSDILVATYPFTIDAVAKLGKNKKLVMHNQHFEELMFSDYSDVTQIRMLNNYPVNHIVNCTWLYKMFKYNYGFDPVVITPGIDTGIFFENENGIRKYSNMENIKIISYCDPSRPFKGYVQQMQIFERLYKLNGDNIEIQFFGNDPKTDAFKYTFLGIIPQKELAEHYRNSHLAIVFSWYESFPLPPVEAMACGCAVISTRYGTEDYLEDGVTGRVIDALDTNRSVDIINETIHDADMLLQFVSNGREMVKNFTWEEQAKKLNQFLLNLKSKDYVDSQKVQQGLYSEFEKLK